MAAIHETAYPRLKSNFNQKELHAIFTPTDEEIALLNEHTRPSLSKPRLGFMLMLKCYQYLGRPVNVEQLAEYIQQFVAEALTIDTPLSFTGYHQSSRKRHSKVIQQYLNMNTNQKDRRNQMKSVALDAANTKENLADIINAVIDSLIRNQFELPAFQSLVRLTRAARKIVNHKNYTTIVNALSQHQKNKIDAMLSRVDKLESGEPLILWADLKIEPKKPTRNKIREYIKHVNQLRQLYDQFNVDLDFIAPARLEQLNNEAIISDKSDMREMKENKRYALTIILIQKRTSLALDALTHVLIAWIRNIQTHAKRQLEAYRLKQAEKIDQFVLVLYNTLLAYKSEGEAEEKIKSISAALNNEADKIIEDCQEYLKLIGDNYIQWTLKPFQNKRSVLYQILENIKVYSSTNDKSIEKALNFLMYYQHSRKEWIEISNEDIIQPELNLLSDNWFKAVTGKKRSKNVEVKKIHRHYYEMAIFSVLVVDLSCADAYVDGSDHYDDPNKRLVTWEEFHESIHEYCAINELPQAPNLFVAKKQSELRQAAKKVDEQYPNNNAFVLKEGQPILKRTPSKSDPPELEELKQRIMSLMPTKNIVEVIIEVEKWLGLSANFKPLSGFEAKMADYPSRFVTTTLSYGCNLGPTQTERSIVKYTRKQIARLFHRHVDDSRLIKTIKKIVNRYNLFELPKKWGTGDSVSVDGTFWDMYEQNLLAAHHIRYGRYGGVGYYHVSDKYIALFSHFISCGAHESVYLLDGIVENDSDIQPNKVHGDSWAQSEVLFGISSLLSVQLMPRIKHLKHLNYYRATSDDRYEHIDELFKEKVSDWELIETHYHDMLRMVLSIHQGKIKSSTLLRKLCSKSRKNKLYFAFRELGRIERTIFLLNYINNPEMQKMIQAATCKSEGFNEFISWIRFGGGGVISDNMQANQRKIIRFNHLVANLLVFHTVVYQTKAINTLREQGVDVPDEILALLSPFWTEHLNRFGIFMLNMLQPPADIEYDLVERIKLS